MSTRAMSWKRWCHGTLWVLGVVLAGSLQAGPFELLSTQDPARQIAGGGGDSLAPVFSPDGRFVLFASSANNLVLNQASNPIPLALPARLNVYRRDRTNGTTVLVSVDPAGLRGGDGDSLPAGLSADGRFALFESSANNLVSGDTNGLADIFVRDLVSNITVLVSVNTNGVAANGVSRSPVMTPDGRYVAFVSEASDLAGQDTNKIADVFVRDRTAGVTTRVSLGAIATNLASAWYGSEAPQITPDGRFVVFRSSATNLVPGVRTGEEIYVRDCVENTTDWVSRGARAALQAAQGKTNAISFNHLISDDGQYVAYETAPAGGTAGVVVRYHVPTQTSEVVDTNAAVIGSVYDDSSNLNMTPDGGVLAFVAKTNRTNQVCLYDFPSGATTLLSRAAGSFDPATGNSDSPVLSPDGRWVAFRSAAADIVPRDTNNANDIFLYDRATRTTRLLTTSLFGDSPAGNFSRLPLFSDDGLSLVFASFASDLAAQDFNQCSDIFAFYVFGSAPVPLLIARLAPGTRSEDPPMVSWPLAPGKAYRVEFKDHLSDPDWQPLPGKVVTVGTQGYFKDATARAGQRFYRVVGY